MKNDILLVVRPYLKKYFPPIDSVERVNHLIEIGEMLLVLHNNCLMHSNLIPSNVLYDEESDNIVLPDYGLNYARMKKREKKPINYLSPEELKNKEVNIGIDIWGYGLLINKYFLEGDDLFEDENVENILECKYSIKDDAPFMLKELLKLIFRVDADKRIEVAKVLSLLKSII